MARHARIISETGIYHIIQRGADRRILFSDDYDYMKFLSILRKIKQETDFSLYAYCLMSNHFHLLLKQNSAPLELIFKKIGCAYVYYYNWKYELHGHLFQDRFRSEAIENDEYFLDVLRYICQNPVKAGICELPEEYNWLGCTGLSNDSFLNPISTYTDLCGEKLRSFVRTPCIQPHIDEVDRKRLTDAEAIAKLTVCCDCTHVQEIGSWGNDRLHNAVVTGIKAGISIRQFSRLTAISKARIEWILKDIS